MITEKKMAEREPRVQILFDTEGKEKRNKALAWASDMPEQSFLILFPFYFFQCEEESIQIMQKIPE